MSFRYIKTVFARTVMCVLCAFALIELRNIYRRAGLLSREASIDINSSNQSINFGTTPKEEPPKVLLLTYLRSGSTLTADIVNLAQEVFYTYEPLKKFPIMEQVYYRKAGVCTHTGICRKARKLSERWEFIVDVIKKFYDCKLDELPIEFLWQTDGSESVKKLHRCLRKNNINACYNQAIEKCKNSLRAIKTIRLSMEIVEVIMHRIPSLKVIHLMRDPRGILRSRFVGAFLPHWKNNTPMYSSSLCEQLSRDFEIGKRLKSKYQDRIKSYLYEYIAENPFNAAENIFQFLTVKPVKYYRQWIYNHTSAGKNSGYYDTSRANSSLTASYWRKSFSLSEVKAVDNHCGKLYGYLNLKTIKTSHQLRDLTIPIKGTKSDERDIELY